MAFRRTLVQRLFNVSNISNPTLTNCRIFSLSSAGQALIPSNPAKVAPDPGDEGTFRRFLQRRPMYQSAVAPKLRSLPMGDELLETLRNMDIARDRIRLDELSPPVTKSELTEAKLTVEDARKLLRVSQLEMVKSKLRQIPKSSISYSEFVQICVEACSSTYQGLEFAKMLDEFGTVIVLGDVVFLWPDQVLKAIQGLMPMPEAHPNDPRRKEFEEMEKQKITIDKKAESLVRRELWCGLGFLLVQTATFMRLTFWELSWDVMEPICFYVTSMYFMAGYAFFLRTAREPSFEGFFQSRFGAKQKRLMKINNFNVGRYNELRKACYPCSSLPEHALSFTPSFSERTEFSGALH
ncbi:hypothetical protein F0562_006482 [Nyssa sinensis]|uniref:Calcium uniporter protein C-terminal domain-containing protein n=1 Tax=Nyssa sinensis TaxID=561372 RepID=A0A5J5ARY1_9ASTE|nr:hypothetical protein F0562_006482 [Nyssa sinensis]